MPEIDSCQHFWLNLVDLCPDDIQNKHYLSHERERFPGRASRVFEVWSLFERTDKDWYAKSNKTISARLDPDTNLNENQSLKLEVTSTGGLPPSATSAHAKVTFIQHTNVGETSHLHKKYLQWHGYGENVDRSINEAFDALLSDAPDTFDPEVQDGIKAAIKGFSPEPRGDYMVYLNSLDGKIRFLKQRFPVKWLAQMMADMASLQYEWALAPGEGFFVKRVDEGQCDGIYDLIWSSAVGASERDIIELKPDRLPDSWPQRNIT